jgi:acyl-CoA thioesterase FadM
MSMDEFVGRGWGWFVKSCTIQYRRALSLNDRVVVQTWLEEFDRYDVRVGFRIMGKEQRMVFADGEFIYTMVNLATNRAEEIPEWVKKQYAQFVEG